MRHIRDVRRTLYFGSDISTAVLGLVKLDWTWAIARLWVNMFLLDGVTWVVSSRVKRLAAEAL